VRKTIIKLQKNKRRVFIRSIFDVSPEILEIFNTVYPPEEFSKSVADFISKAFIAIPQQVIKKIDSLKSQYKVSRNCKSLEVNKS